MLFIKINIKIEKILDLKKQGAIFYQNNLILFLNITHLAV